MKKVDTHKNVDLDSENQKQEIAANQCRMILDVINRNGFIYEQENELSLNMNFEIHTTESKVVVTGFEYYHQENEWSVRIKVPGVSNSQLVDIEELELDVLQELKNQLENWKENPVMTEQAKEVINDMLFNSMTDLHKNEIDAMVNRYEELGPFLKEKFVFDTPIEVSIVEYAYETVKVLSIEKRDLVSFIANDDESSDDYYFDENEYAFLMNVENTLDEIKVMCLTKTTFMDFFKMVQIIMNKLQVN